MYALPSIESYGADGVLKLKFKNKLAVDGAFKSNLIATEKLMKLRNALRLVLVHTFDLYHDMKTFEWRLEGYSEDSMTLRIDFHNPKYISVAEIDTMELIFAQDEMFYSPLDANRVMIMPDGYKLEFKLPPIGPGLMNLEQLEELKTNI